MRNEIFVGVITAVVLSVLAVTWNALTGGGLIRALGGITQKELDTLGFIPAGGVVAFDMSPTEPLQCPKGWRSHREVRGRVIVGAGEHKNEDSSGSKIPQFTSIGEISGVADLKPEGGHNHFVRQKRDDRGGRFGNDGPDDHWSTEGVGHHDHGGNNMQPSIAFLYCVKE